MCLKSIEFDVGICLKDLGPKKALIHFLIFNSSVNLKNKNPS